MSYANYDTQERPRRQKSHRHREPDFYEEEVIERKGNRERQLSLVRRRDDSVDSVEEVQRNFPPGGDGTYVQRRTKVRDVYPPRRARSERGGRYDDDLSRSASGGRRNARDKRSRRRDYSSYSSSPSPPPRTRRKSLGEQALAALGIGGAAGALVSKGDRDRDYDHGRDRSRGGGRRRRSSSSSYDSRSRSRDRSGNQQQKIQQAVKAALTAGAVEAFRARKDPGGWGGGKGKRVLTAAIGAGGIDGLLDKDPDKHSTRNTITSVIGGLAANRVANGPRSRSRSRGPRKSDNGGGGGGLGALAAGGLAAAAGKAFMDHRSRSKSRGRGRYSSDEYSRSPPRRDKKRSSSVSAYVTRGLNKGMAALGISEAGQDDRREDNRDRRVSRRDRDYDDGYSNSRSMPQDRGPENGGKARGWEEGKKKGSGSSSSSEDLSTSEEDRRRKKMRGKEYLTAGLATVATIHAAHSVYQSVEKRQKRHKEVLEGKMSPEEAAKKKRKATLQDAASIGIAALGIKGAVSEWKEMKEQRDECMEFEHSRQEKREKREQKALEQRRRSRLRGSSNGAYRHSDPNLAYYPNGYAAGPRYQDGNPYSAGALPPPPMANGRH